jgi:dipeptidyl aminopeptidase/acylaminoacyl peptidase
LFPEEGHWILKPQDSQFWYATVIDWLTQYSKKLPDDAKAGPGN